MSPHPPTPPRSVPAAAAPAPPSPAPTSADPDRVTLLNCARLAQALDVWAGYVTAMRKAGFVFTAANRTTLKSALAWLAEHPGFRADHFLKPRRARKKKRVRRQAGKKAATASGARAAGARSPASVSAPVSAPVPAPHRSASKVL